MTVKRKATNELSKCSDYKRNIISLRHQYLEGMHDGWKTAISNDYNNDNADDADRMFNLTTELRMQARNTVDVLYPKEEDCGEVVAMGTEDVNACGLIEDPDDERLYGTFLLAMPSSFTSK